MSGKQRGSHYTTYKSKHFKKIQLSKFVIFNSFLNESYGLVIQPNETRQEVATCRSMTIPKIFKYSCIMKQNIYVYKLFLCYSMMTLQGIYQFI